MNILVIVLSIGAMCFFYSFDVLAKNEAQSMATNTIYAFKFEKPDTHCENLKVSGYMLGHNHGLPTNPVVSDAGEHQCVVKGLMFNMAGKWKIQISRDNETVRILSFDVR